MLPKDTLEIVLNPGPRLLQSPFPGGKGDVGLTSRDRPLSPERVCCADFIQDGYCSLHASVRQRGGFPNFHRSEGLYFQIPIHQLSRKLLRFLSEETVFQFKALCFGVSTAPQVFTKVFAAVSAWAHSHGTCLLRYLDDWLVLVSSEVEAKKNVQDLLSLCHSLVIVINNEKSDLVPSQTANYLSMTIFTGAALAGGFEPPGLAGETSSSQSTWNALSAAAFEDALVSRVGSSLPPGAFVPGGGERVYLGGW